MPTGYLSNPIIFLVNALVGAYIFVLIIRTLLQYSGADSRNPISAFFIKVTRVPLAALKPIFPTFKGINTAAIVLIVALQMLIGFVMLSGLPGLNIWAIFIWSMSEFIVNVINVFTYSIFITVILSWINPGAHNPIIELLHKITEPVLRPCQRFIPPIGGLDLSPMAALLGLQVLKMLLLPPLRSLM
ncbi:MAG: YggT family protein [Piscirickettsiaceae bacterium]|nr:MAG: YggT family protein [Piscirickettsiaceae bacterium]